MAKKIPYGLTDYLRIVTEDYYYVDKTRYIEDLEKTAAFLFLIRPRRFGKSLFLNMLYCYYDVRYADKFDELFGNQYIGKHPTSEQGKYLYFISISVPFVERERRWRKTSTCMLKYRWRRSPISMHLILNPASHRAYGN